MKYMITFSLIITSYYSNAQIWNEWSEQKKTQKIYLVQQVVALKVYLEFLKKGYDIANKGLNMIGNIKDGNFNDHSTYFGSLKLVNPRVKSNSKIDLIVAYQVAIMDDFGKLNNECKKNNNLTDEEIRYVASVYNNLLTECDRSISTLNAIITDDASQMQDDERIERIEAIHEDMMDKYSFTGSFCNSTRMLMMQRYREESEVRTDKIINSGS